MNPSPAERGPAVDDPERRRDTRDAAPSRREDELVAVLRALAQHGLREGDWVCSLRTRISGQIAVDRAAEHPALVIETDLGILRAASDACANLAEWQRCAPWSRGLA
ncbi:MAG TPA: hypothetical protein VMU33_04375 [Burkholderiaceae bacterium]|nr:hypothetical protein [Burkholderiaceae bacterium]